jgi:hypothetical protein
MPRLNVDGLHESLVTQPYVRTFSVPLRTQVVETKNLDHVTVGKLM